MERTGSGDVSDPCELRDQRIPEGVDGWLEARDLR